MRRPLSLAPAARPVVRRNPSAIRGEKGALYTAPPPRRLSSAAARPSLLSPLSPSAPPPPLTPPRYAPPLYSSILPSSSLPRPTPSRFAYTPHATNTPATMFLPISSSHQSIAFESELTVVKLSPRPLLTCTWTWLSRSPSLPRLTTPVLQLISRLSWRSTRKSRSSARARTV